VGESPGRWRERVAEGGAVSAFDLSLVEDEMDGVALLPLRSRHPHQAVREPDSALSPRRLKRTLEYIETNLARPLCLAELSELNGLSKMHFSAQFRRATGLPPYAYVLRQRIFRGQQLLAETEDSTVNIALALGFTSQAHFTTAFKKVVGDTPARWRREQVARRSAACQ
jgi:AraC-like DNA-binding protein